MSKKFKALDGKYCENREHAYGDYFSSVDWAERILDENQGQGKALVQGLANYIRDRYDHGRNRKAAETKARQILGIQDNSHIDRLENNYGPERAWDLSWKEKREFVLKAVDSGFLENFRLHEPWHPQPFLSGGFVSYPFQHSTAIVYRGISRDNFYVEEKKPESKQGSMRNPISIINQGYLNPGNSFNDDNDNAVWTSPYLEYAAGYGNRTVEGLRGVVLEIQAPTKWIICGAHGERLTSSLEEMHEEFGSPENYRQHVLEHEESRPQDVSFLIESRLPIKYVTGVWDREMFEEPRFVPLQSRNERDIVDIMHMVQRNRIPQKGNFARADNPEEAVNTYEELQEIQREYFGEEGFLIELSNLLDRIEANAERMIRYIRKLHKETIDHENTIDNIFDQNKSFETGLKKIHEIVAEASGEEIVYDEVTISTPKELQEAYAENLRTIRENEEIIKEAGKEIDAKREQSEALMAEIARKGEVDSQHREQIERLTEIENQGLLSFFRELKIVRIEKENFREYVESSTIPLRKRVREIEYKIDRGIEACEDIAMIEKRLKELVELSDKLIQQGEMNRDEWNEVYKRIANGGANRIVGVNEYLRRADQNLRTGRFNVTRDSEDVVEIQSLPQLREVAGEYLQMLQKRNSQIEEAEKSLENYRDELEEIEERIASQDSYSEELEQELEKIENSDSFQVLENIVKDSKWITINRPAVSKNLQGAKLY